MRDLERRIKKLEENSTHKEVDILKLIPNYEELSSLDKFLACLKLGLITGEEINQGIIEVFSEAED